MHSGERVHVIGKGITRFHAVYWLAFLLSAGQPLPSAIYVHEYLSVNGAKLSKSAGNAISPYELADRFGTDAVRWWLLREVARSGDTDFTVERLVKRANGDLANGLGNLQNRTLTLVHNYREGQISKPSGATSVGTQLVKAYQALPYLIDEALARFDFRAATDALWSVVEASNQLIETPAPLGTGTTRRAGRAGGDAAGRSAQRPRRSLPHPRRRSRAIHPHRLIGPQQAVPHRRRLNRTANAHLRATGGQAMNANKDREILPRVRI